jgi:hypothetical protein
MALRRYFGKISFLDIGNLVGHNGELVIDEATDKIYIMDGINPGGHEIANVSANLNLEYTNVSPAINSAYTLGTSAYRWNNLYVNDSNFFGNLHIDTYINPDKGLNNWGNLQINANKLYANRLYAQTDISTDGTLSANIISANGFIEINTTNFSGYTFSGLGNGTTGLIHANVGSIPTIYLAANGNPSLTTYANGYNTVGGYTQFYSNVYITGNNVTIPNYTTIGLLPSFNPANARFTYVDSVNSYSQVLLQNKSNGTSASGDIVVTADNGSDSSYYIDLGINSSTFSGGGGLDAANDGYLLVEGGKLVVATLTANKDIVFAIGGDSASNEVGRFKTGELNLKGNVIPAANVTYSLGNVNYQWQDLYLSNSSIYMGGVPLQYNGSALTIGGQVLGNSAVSSYLNTNSQISFQNIAASGNVTIQGNLIVNGNTTTVSTQNLIINDNIIYIANANPSYTLDIGFAGHFTAGTYQHTGLVRQASSNVWKLFSNVSAEPGNTVDFTNAVYDAIQTGAITSPTITDIYSNLGSLTSNASTQASNLASLTTNAASQASDISTLYTNAATQASNLGAIVGGTVTHANLITTGGLYWSNGVSALTSASTYGNTQVSAYYVANTVATSNVQILRNGNIRLPTGATINESSGNGYLTLNPNTSADALAGVVIGGSGYLLSPNGTRNAVLNYNAVNGQMGIYVLNVYGNQQNAIVNGGSNNYGNIGSISTFFGNAFVSNIYSQNYLYPNGTSILSGVSGTYGNTQVGYYLNSNLISSTISITGNVIANAHYGNSFLYSNGVSILTGISGTYGNTQVGAYLPTYTGNIGSLATGNLIPTANTTYYLGNSTLYWANAYANNFNAATQLATPKIQFTVGGSQILEDNSLDLAIIGPYQVSIKPNGVYQYTFNNTGSLSGPGGIFVYANGAVYGNVIATGVYWSNGVAYSSGSGTYGNTQVGYYLNSNLISSTISVTGNVIANAHYGNSFLYSNGVSILSGISGSGTPSGGNTMIQFANSGSFGGSTYLQYNYISGNLVSNSTTTSTSTTTGAIVVGGGVGIGGALTVGGNVSAGNVNVTANVNAANINVTGNLTYGNISTTGNVTAGYLITTGTGGNITGANYVIASNFTATGTANVGNVITTSGVYWANGVAYSSGSGTYGNTEVAAYLPTYAGNVNAAFFNGNGYYLTGLTGANYSNTNVASYILGNITVGNIVTSGGGQLSGYITGVLGANTPNTVVATTVTTSSGGQHIGYFTGALGANTPNTVVATTVTTSSGGQHIGYHTGAIGANTANTGAFTTISATGNITATTANVYAANIVGNTAVYGATFKYSNGAAYDGTYSNSNVASYLPTYTGNVGAGNLIGTSSNVTITASANVWTFDNTGNLTLPNLSSVYVLGANTNGNININTVGTGSVNITGNLVANTAGFNVGYLNIPQVAFTANATIAATDSGKHYYSTLSTANTLTISNNAVTSWQVGTSISIVNGGSGTMTIAPGSGVTLYLAGNSSSASRTLSSYGMATILNVAANVWYINGSGLA